MATETPTPEENTSEETPAKVPFYKNKRLLAIVGATTAVVAAVGLGARSLKSNDSETDLFEENSDESTSPIN